MSSSQRRTPEHPGEPESDLDELRADIDRINDEILSLIQSRAGKVLEIARRKREMNLDGHDPHREAEMLQRLTGSTSGPFGPTEIQEIFRVIFRASLDMQDRWRRGSLRVRREDLLPEGRIRVGPVSIGAGEPVLFAGPCSVESEEQMDQVASFLSTLTGSKILRAGSYKPRSSPYSFQGLREEGLRILRETGRRHRLATVTEVLDTSHIDRVAASADMLQVGARNMFNTEMLKALGRIRKPILLKRGFMATVEELLLSAEYILAGGNHAVVLCERGIRTFQRSVRNTLDISAVALLKQQTSLPVIVDVSHATGRRDILLPCARAALAAGADGLMIEVHPNPELALSDGFQQIDIPTFAGLAAELGFMAAGERAASRQGR